MKNQLLLIGAALITLYIVLGISYESCLPPLTILSTLPSAGAGALLALMACGTEFNVVAQIGRPSSRAWVGGTVNALVPALDTD